MIRPTARGRLAMLATIDAMLLARTAHAASLTRLRARLAACGTDDPVRIKDVRRVLMRVVLGAEDVLDAEDVIDVEDCARARHAATT